MIQTIWIPNWHPATLNELLRLYNNYKLKHHVRQVLVKKRKQADADIIALHAKQQNVSHAAGKRSVRITIKLKPRQRMPDLDAHLKSCWDGLATCGLLVNDSPKWCAMEPTEHSRGTAEDWGTEIRLTDLEKPCCDTST